MENSKGCKECPFIYTFNKDNLNANNIINSSNLVKIR